ncbi:hypothetical protein Bhyg_09766 [Pseudolycoriella hygida]|uniref:Uncharacterized protein n=1 Tax=Pseudolycoriella hygida TaxID=35572 RepID=A0A9Q0MTZ6_9DIPT|nr:hypothetical protein Bhyg_09766 [Pseudolycoriella hygida]
MSVYKDNSFEAVLFTIVDSATSALDPNITTVQETAVITTRRNIEESDVITTVSAPTDIIDDAKATVPSFSIAPVIAAVTNLFEASNTSPTITDNNIEELDSASTHFTPVTETTPITLPTTTLGTMMPIVDSKEQMNEISKQSNEAFWIASTASFSDPPIISTTITSTTKQNPSETEILPGTSLNIMTTAFDDQFTSTLQPSTIQVSSLASSMTEAAIVAFLDVIPTKSGSDLPPLQNDLDNGSTTSTNENTISIPPKEIKLENNDMQVRSLAVETEPPKANEKQNKNDSNDKSGCNSITTCFVVLSMAVIHVII